MADTSILSLCAGVGMLDEGICSGLRYIGRQGRVLGYVERDAYAAAVLLARMESKALEPAPVWAGNLQDVRWEQFTGAVDILCAGFPCQPHSMAGSRKGIDDDRWIWPAIAECIRVVRPGLVLLENVSGLRSSGGMAPVLADLAALGFRIEWDSIRASDVGAAHQRERVFILGVDDANGSERWPVRIGGSGGEQGTDGEGEANRRSGISSSPCVGNAGLQHQHPQQWPDGSEYPGAGISLAYPSEPRPEGREQHGTHVADGRTDGRTDVSII